MTLVFGNPFLEMFEHGLVRSMLWPRNNAALRSVDSEWNIYCYANERDRIEKIIAPVGIKHIFHDIIDIHAIAEKLDATFLLGMKRSVSEGSAFMPMQPDIVFGEGSIQTLITLASENDERCIAMSHPRVNAAPFIKQMQEGVMENDQMVALAFKNLHPSWADSNISLDSVNCWHSGVAWREFGYGLYGVTDRLPTIFIARMKPEDIVFFESANRTGAWDHLWPSSLMREQRQRLIGSSDAAFCVELTDEKTHRSLTRGKLANQKDIYRFDLEHHRVNRNTMTVWRARC